MSKGQLCSSSSQRLADPLTGASIRQVTDHPSIHHQPFYYLPAYDNAMQWLFFISHRSGQPQLYAEDRHAHRILQLTDHEGINEWSVHPSHGGRYVYFTTSAGAWRVNTGTLAEDELARFDSVRLSEKGVAGTALSTTSLSHDDRWWAVPLKVGPTSRLVIIDTQTGDYDIVLERDAIGHPEFHPSDATLLRYAGPYCDRMWVVNRDGSGNRLVYKRHVEQKEWIVHETWRPGTRELVVTNWGRGMIGVDIDSGAARPVCSFNAWHASINRQGTLMCADTTYPDIGLQIFDPRDGVGAPRTLCLSRSSNIGAHWNTDHCPYDDGISKPYAPQHTHPHPAFSPDGQYVVFTSDRTGFSQVYEVKLPDPSVM